jgi:hypothetical protein
MSSKNHRRKQKAKYVKKSISPVSKSSRIATLITFFGSFYSIIGILVTLSGVIGLFTFWPQINDLFASRKEKWKDQTFVRGILIPQSLLSSTDTINLELGTVSFRDNVHNLKQGIEFKQSRVLGCGSSPVFPFDLRFKIENNRLYFATTFKDIQKEEVVGIIDFRTWSLVKSNLLDYNETDESLEVIDRSGNIIFSLLYKYPNTISIKGYFVAVDCITVVSKGISTYPINSKREALSEIQTISHIQKE